MDVIGKIIKGRYQIYDHVGDGAVASVYVGRDVNTNRIVAVKIIHPHLLADGKFLGCFEREARLMQQIRSEHVVQVWDCGTEPDMHYIVLEFVQGWSLAKIIKMRGSLPIEEGLDIARQIASALQQAEARQIVHRDVKPANILVDYAGCAKLTDFGIARSLMHTGTSSTGVLGTPNYISPEQADGLTVDIRADIYSLGATLYEMLTGDILYSGDSPIGVMMKHLRAPIPKVSEKQEAVPPAIDALVARCLAKKPAERFLPTELIAAIDVLSPPRASIATQPYVGTAGAAGKPTPLPQLPGRPQRARLIGPAGHEYGVLGPVALVGRPDERTGAVPEVDLTREAGGTTVSRRHARVRFADGRWLLEPDPMANNPTFVNGKQVAKGAPVSLQDGDSVQFGAVKMTFQLIE
ncbi:MAG: protein kinase [Chloroflexi bacterium]|nr:protein kinase [Chloroflexota bacterium]